MKKIISLFTSVIVISAPLMSVIACGAEDGNEVKASAFWVDPSSGDVKKTDDMYSNKLNGESSQVDAKGNATNYNWQNNIVQFVLLPLWAINVSEASESGSGAKAPQQIYDHSLENQKENLENPANSSQQTADLWKLFFEQPSQFDSYYTEIDLYSNNFSAVPDSSLLSNINYWKGSWTNNGTPGDNPEKFTPSEIDSTNSLNQDNFINTVSIVDPTYPSVAQLNGQGAVSYVLDYLNNNFLNPFSKDKPETLCDNVQYKLQDTDNEDLNYDFHQELSEIIVRLPDLKFDVTFEDQDKFTFSFTVSNVVAHLTPKPYSLTLDGNTYWYWSWTFDFFDFWTPDSLTDFSDNNDYAFKYNNYIYYSFYDGGLNEADWNTDITSRSDKDEAGKGRDGFENKMMYNEDTEIVAVDMDIEIDPNSIKQIK
ncbi:hypothetical protein [Spiroplasma endosymbiont of Amphibalanus improvisus]|uniref:hypothetical protein n=1 Tax=Spiroplasma endosymbiont of Amphibalanus improvisus TaxID=3066327 RepID=UPI00313B0CCE